MYIYISECHTAKQGVLKKKKGIIKKSKCKPVIFDPTVTKKVVVANQEVYFIFV